MENLRVPSSLLELLKEEDQRLRDVRFCANKVIRVEGRLEDDSLSACAVQMYQNDKAVYEKDLEQFTKTYEIARTELSKALKSYLA